MKDGAVFIAAFHMDIAAMGDTIKNLNETSKNASELSKELKEHPSRLIWSRSKKQDDNEERATDGR